MDKTLGFGGSIRDPIVFPRDIPSGYSSESPSDYPTEYPSQVPITKPLTAPNETPTKYPSRVTKQFPIFNPINIAIETRSGYPIGDPRFMKNKFPKHKSYQWYKWWYKWWSNSCTIHSATHRKKWYTQKSTNRYPDQSTKQ